MSKRKKDIKLFNEWPFDDIEIREIEVPQGEAYCFIFPPGQSHAIKNLSEDINILIAFNTIGHDTQNPDTEVDVLL